MFGLSKRAITILFGLLALAFALGAILLFTPQAAQQTRGNPLDRKSTRLNSSHPSRSRMPSSA